MATNKFVATFSDGETKQRGSARNYSHAWRVRWTEWEGQRKWEQIGFSESLDGAWKAARGWQARKSDAEREVVTVEPQ